MPQEPGAHEPPELQHAPPTAPSPTSSVPAELGDLAALKALAQPRRQRILEHLTLHGPATSATLARALGLNTGSTSYHLRELARYGFVEETDGEETDGEEGQARSSPSQHRERWWRVVPGDRRFPPRSRQSPETRHVMDELNHHAYAADLDLFERLQRESAEGDPWADAFPYSRGTIRLTLPELREFFEEYIALLNRYKRPESETLTDARTLLTRFLAFPVPSAPPAAAPMPTVDGDPERHDPARHASVAQRPAHNRREADPS
ncbi:helix-turn-helix domain-containing protein [Streptomyces bobili]|uniref:helix-turn-helix domain-containing protein n=1 Tax=Streptomyces bobili TaxID=67280 RepID=UPI00341483B3